MNDSLLSEAELGAIRETMGQASPPPGPAAAAIPVALVTDDRSALAAKPAGLRIADRWASTARLALRRVTGLEVQLDVAGAEAADAPTLKDALGDAFLCGLEAAARPGVALVAVSGPIIAQLAARLLGARAVGPADERRPTRALLRLFAPFGDALVEALRLAWREENGGDVRAVGDSARIEAIRQSLRHDEPMIVVTVAASGPVSGRLQLIAQPALLSTPAPARATQAAAAGAIASALGAVPVEVIIELGRAALSIADFRRLVPGQVIGLDRVIDDPLTIRLAGRAKARGRALVVHGALAVEIVAGGPREE